MLLPIAIGIKQQTESWALRKKGRTSGAACQYKQMKKVLQRLFEHDTLSRSEAEQILTRIAEGAFNPVQVSSFITAYNMRPITVAELEGFRDAMLQKCIPFSTGGMDTLDIVGTGGDGKNTFNISTTSAIVIAGAGYPVTKHGSYGVSSAVGSSNVLLALGYSEEEFGKVYRGQVIVIRPGE